MRNQFQEMTSYTEEAYRAVDMVASMCGDWMPATLGIMIKCQQIMMLLFELGGELEAAAQVWSDNLEKQ
jgi:hypothetical protein